MRSPSILLVCLCLAACGGETQPEPPPPPAEPVKSAEQRAIERRLRQAGEARSRDEKARREKALRDAMHSPVQTLPQKAPR